MTYRHDTKRRRAKSHKILNNKRGCVRSHEILVHKNVASLATKCCNEAGYHFTINDSSFAEAFEQPLYFRERLIKIRIRIPYIFYNGTFLKRFLHIYEALIARTTKHQRIIFF